MKRVVFFILTLVLAACQSTPAPVNADLGAEFTLAPEQTATIAASGLTIRLVAVSGDDRCPSGVECYASGPVTLQISVQAGSSSPTEFLMQTFTSYDGRAPEGPFEGIQDRVEFDGYRIRVVTVLPYPHGFGGKVKARDYRVSFVVTAK
jgi:hypothetical protein